MRSMFLNINSYIHELIDCHSNKNRMFGDYFYPLIVVVCIATFIGMLFGNGLSMDRLYPATVRMVVVFATFLCSYYLISFAVAKFSPSLLGFAPKRLETDKLICYSMVVVMLIDMCLGLFPNFRIIAWIVQFYTVKIVWEGVDVVLRIPEDKRLAYTMIVSAMILLVPVLLGRTMSTISVNI